MFLGIMHLSLPIFLATQLLLYREAFSCDDVTDYEISGECCPKCRAGSRVDRHCTATSGTICLACAEGTYMDLPNGLLQCFVCDACESGIHLRVKQKCTATKNTVCSCEANYFCSQFIGKDCERCSRHAISPPGFMVTQAGTETNDTKFKPCPAGTFSATEMSTSCEPWTNCTKAGMKEKQAGTPTSDAQCVCLHDNHIPTPVFIATVTSLVLLFGVASGIIIWRCRKHIKKGAVRRQREELNGDYPPVQENYNKMVAPMQETAQHPGESTYVFA
ncbi:tumor necrosis factor receptor superfamily member 14 [Rhineura floridana]|uniref:tumor necrosis factor receptor superfamily member 14 n=1 Tax=Rhineura floridana TaxID=261503 RepID=UPI002AC81344|nr:tumor necrosis factor receptor superfamily member 14 [Rhineura floridana]